MNKVHLGNPRSTSPAKEYATPVVESCRIHSLKCDMCVYVEGENTASRFLQTLPSLTFSNDVLSNHNL